MSWNETGIALLFLIVIYLAGRERGTWRRLRWRWVIVRNVWAMRRELRREMKRARRG